MSYDIRFGVKVAGADDLFVEIGRPTFDSPTYNLGTMFRKCTGWDYNQGEWYNVAEVLPLIQQGIHELKFNPKEYRQYNPKNGWGDIGSALEALQSMEDAIRNLTVSDGWTEVVPPECLYVKW